MKLERHVGGLSLARKANYLQRRGWRELEGGWSHAELQAAPIPIKKAAHHQLTRDLGKALSATGWKVVGYSKLGYAQMEDPLGLKRCSLPSALRRQARREKRAVAELTYTLFLAALL